MSNAHPPPPTPAPERPDRGGPGSPPPRPEDLGPTDIPPRGAAGTALLLTGPEVRDLTGRIEWTHGRTATSSGWVNFEWVDVDGNWEVTVNDDPAIDVRVAGNYQDAQKYASQLASLVSERSRARTRLADAETELAAWIAPTT